MSDNENAMICKSAEEKTGRDGGAVSGAVSPRREISVMYYCCSFHIKLTQQCLKTVVLSM